MPTNLARHTFFQGVSGLKIKIVVFRDHHWIDCTWDVFMRGIGRFAELKCLV